MQIGGEPRAHIWVLVGEMALNSVPWGVVVVVVAVVCWVFGRVVGDAGLVTLWSDC